MNELAENSLQKSGNHPKPVDYGKKLRPKVRKFAHLYHMNGNAAQSFIDAGYSPNGARQNAFRLMTDDYLCLYLEQLQAETEAEHKAIFGSIIQRTNEITRIAERGKLQTNSRGEPVMVDGKPVYVKDTASALKGLDQLSKLGGLYDKNIDKSNDSQPWTGIEIDYGDGTLRVVTGTGPMQARGNSGGTSGDSSKNKTETIDVTGAIK